MFYRIPHMRVLSEPWAACTIHEDAAKGHIDMTEYKALLQSAFRLHCKVEPGEEVRWMAIKTCIFHGPQYPLLAEIFPNFVLTFNTRHPVPSMHSYVQSSHGGWRWKSEGRYGVPIGQEWDKYAPTYDKNAGEEECGVRFYALIIKQYLKVKHIYKRAIFYENIAKDSQKELLQLFKLLNIPEDNLKYTSEALKHDSQNGTFGQRGKVMDLPPDVDDRMDDIFAEYGIPVRKSMSPEEFMECLAL